jgi:hypothetical protein
MLDNKKQFKELPKETKFATIDSGKEDDILMEIFIANLIHNGASFSMLMKPVELVESKKDKEELKTIITNITLDFIKLNPESTEVLKRNDNARVFLNNFGLDL